MLWNKKNNLKKTILFISEKINNKLYNIYIINE